MERSEFHSEINSLCGKIKPIVNEKDEKKVINKSTKTKTVKKDLKPKSTKKISMESTSTRVHGNSLVCSEAN